MSLIGTGLFFLWAFCKLGFSHPGKGYRFCAVLVWNPGATPCDGLYTEAPPERGTFFRLQERYVRKFELQAPTTEVWHDSDRASISPSNSIRPVADPDLQMGGGGLGHPDSEIKGVLVSKKNFSRTFGPLFGLKLRGHRTLPPPPLDTPLKTTGNSARQRRIKKKMFQNLK